MSINLIPLALQRRQHQRRRLRVWAVVLAVAVGILAIPIGLDWSRRANAKQLRVKAAGLEHSQSQVQTEWDTMRRDLEETQAHIERADALRSKRAWSAMVILIASKVPADVWLTKIATDPVQPAAQAKPRAAGGLTKPREPEEILTIDAPTKIKIDGYAPRATEPLTLVRNLRATGVFTTVSLLRSSLETRDGGNYFHFSLVCEW